MSGHDDKEASVGAAFTSDGIFCVSFEPVSCLLMAVYPLGATGRFFRVSGVAGRYPGNARLCKDFLSGSENALHHFWSPHGLVCKRTRSYVTGQYQNLIPYRSKI